MSAIFGYSRSDMSAISDDHILRMLDHWNTPYGADAVQMRSVGPSSGLGCRIEHFAHSFPWGGPILEWDQKLVVIDALLYNRDELADQLSRPELLSVSDEELLLTWIREKGYDALASVNGDFAGAVYDPQSCAWTLFRDHLGVRPLYYYLHDHSFAFSTDIRGLTAFGGQRCRPNATFLYNTILGFNPLTPCETEYQDILCVPPGSYMELTPVEDGFRAAEHRYWRLKQKKIRLDSEQAYEQELYRLVSDAVKRRLDAVPGKVGAELSGGLDSSVIAILMHRLGADACHYSWSVSPDNLPLQEGEDERKVIFDICSQENITCQFRDPEDRFRLEDALEHVVPAHTNTFELTLGSRWMRGQGARAVFTGHGGDEGISHRPNPYELFYHREYAAYFKLYRDFYTGRRLRAIRAPLRAVRDLIGFHRTYAKPSHLAHFDCRELLSSDFRKRTGAVAQEVFFHFHYAPEVYIEQGGTRPRMDNAAFQGALSGVRYLFPYVDHRVMDFAVSIPRALYFSSTMDRKIFRNAFRDIIPDSLYRVFYKDLASRRNRNVHSSITQDDARENLIVRDLLDRDYWGDILDWDAIDRLEPPSMDDPAAVSHFYISIANLTKCLLIQHVATRAQEIQHEQ